MPQREIPQRGNPTHDIIVIGASAGGIEALKVLVARLPGDLLATIFVACHLSPDSPGYLPHILSAAGALPAENASDGAAITPGRIFVAPPDRHLLVEAGQLRVTRGPKENRFRPAIDPLFRSAALAYGPRVVGVVLSGSLSDGTAGLWAVKLRGGKAVVQDPDEALFPSMPRSAMSTVEVDYTLPVATIAPLLVQLAAETAEAGGQPVSEAMKIETRIAKEDNALEAGVTALGSLSPFTCPECHGILVQIKEGPLLRFRCHTGHAYSVQSLLTEIGESTEEALWKALRVIDESVMLTEHIVKHLREAHDGAQTERFEAQAQEARRKADLLRQVLFKHEREAELPEDLEAGLPEVELPRTRVGATERKA